MTLQEIKAELLSSDLEDLKEGITIGGLKVRIIQDQSASPPTKNFDMVGTCLSWPETYRTSHLEGTEDGVSADDWKDEIYMHIARHPGVYAANGFQYPDKEDYRFIDEPDGDERWEKYRDAIINRYAVVSDDLSTTHCRSHSVGIVFFAMRSELREEMAVKRLNTYKAKRLLTSQAEEVKTWAEGEVYVYIVERLPADECGECEDIERHSGMYGFNYCADECAKVVLEALADPVVVE